MEEEALEFFDWSEELAVEGKAPDEGDERPPKLEVEDENSCFSQGGLGSPSALESGKSSCNGTSELSIVRDRTCVARGLGDDDNWVSDEPLCDLRSCPLEPE